MSKHLDSVSILLHRLQERYGEKYELYGSSENEQGGAGFRISDIPTNFSVLCFDEALFGRFDIQVESYPPGDYLYTVEAYLPELLELVECYRKPMDEWPVN